MTIANDPAFPVPGFNDDPSTPERFIQPCPGMTLRQHYAGIAMLGILSNGNMIDGWTSTAQKWVAERAVIQADALIKELEKT